MTGKCIKAGMVSGPDLPTRPARPTSPTGLVAACALGAIALVASSDLVNGQDRLRTQPGLPSQPEPGTPQGTPTRPAARPGIPPYDDGNVEALHVQGNIYLVAGGGANVVVQRGAEGLLLVNTGPARSAPTPWASSPA